MSHAIVEVLYPYSAAEKNQISLQPRERIVVLEKDKSGWWIGRRDTTGEVGIFPSTYVREVADRLKFNRPKELKQLPISNSGGDAQPSRRTGGATRQTQRDMRAELGFDDSESGEDVLSPGSDGSRRRGHTDAEGMRDMRRRLQELSRAKEDLDRRLLVTQEERLRAEKDAKDFRRQNAILKQQNIVMHEKVRQIKYDLDEAQEVIRSDGHHVPSPPYRQDPDEAVRGWLDSAIKDRCEEDRVRIQELERRAEELEERLAEAADDEEASPASSAGKAKAPAAKAPASPSPTPDNREQQNGTSLTSGRIRRGDTVRLREAGDDDSDDGGVLAAGAEGTVVDVVLEGCAGRPFLVRGPGQEQHASRTWYSEAALQFVRAAEPAAAVAAAAPSAGGADAAALKDRDKKIKKLEKKVKVLEDDLTALEKYNGKLEKKMEKLKKTAAEAEPSAEQKEELKRLRKEVESSGVAPESPAPKGGADPARLEAAETALAEAQKRAAEETEALKAALSAAEAREAEAKEAATKAASAGSAAQSAQAKELDSARLELAERTAELQAADKARADAALRQTEAEAAADKAGKEAADLRRQLGDWATEKDSLQQRAKDAERKAEETIAANAAQLQYAMDRYKREEKRRRELYNQLMELKGNIRVYCRLKPCLGDERNECISFDDDMTVRIKDPQSGKNSTFEFDLCFPGETLQADVYRDVRGLAVSVLDGYYVCIFAYGQTGSGKTYTMEGPAHDRGVNFRTVEDLFVNAEERSGEYEYEMTVSILEVYNDQVYDLQGKRCVVKVSAGGKEEGVKIDPLVRTPVRSTQQVVDALASAYEHRSVGGTSMNAHSSRSHCVLSVWIDGKNKATGAKIRGKLHLIDLAGSERLKQSQAEGERLVEATHINKSLTSLGLCISSLANRKDHIPYRNSKLTYLLQDSLGGNCKCLMFANISPLSSNVPETISTLKFATNARKVDLGKAEKMKA